MDLISRRVFSFATALAVLPTLAWHAAAVGAETSYPERQVRLIVPFSAGGASDIMGRLLAQKLSERWKAQVYVENRPGAGGNIGMDVVAKSAPDGYNIVLMNNAAASNEALNPNLPFDVTTDFIPVRLVASTPMILAAHPSVQASNIDELTAALKAAPDKYTYGSCGAGGPQNFATELYKYLAKVDIVHAPYRGCSQAASDLLGGQIQLATLSSAVALPHVQAGKMKAIATTISQRMPAAPDIPTFRESSVPELKDYEFDIWYGVMVPTGTPQAIVDKLGAAIDAILDQPDVKKSMAGAGIDELRGSGEALAKLLAADIEKSAVVVKYSGMTVQ